MYQGFASKDQASAYLENAVGIQISTQMSLTISTGVTVSQGGNPVVGIFEIGFGSSSGGIWP